MNEYLRRTLTYYGKNGELQRIEDVDILRFPVPAIVLAEPGMGKTRLLRRLAEEPGTTFRSAASFVDHPDPASLVGTGWLILDGLDELSAVRESDPVYRVLAQLIRAGRPRFILSCRVADWRGATTRQDISEEYRDGPVELRLDALSREDAIDFLEEDIKTSLAHAVVKSLEENGIPDLYGNPLTLSLFGEIADKVGKLPQTRSELLRRACGIMWNERNDRHDKSPLSAMDEDTALSAVGAASAALVLTGSEGIGLMPSSIGRPHVLTASEIGALPGGRDVRTLVGSRLFTKNELAPDQFKPIHRIISEYLGARWLANHAKDVLARERLYSMITFQDGVPASLRGIHAWLAHFSPDLASSVIQTDPYGLLRYGDADELTIEQGRQLLYALKRLQTENPYFRAEDWSRHSARGIAKLELLADLRTILLAQDTNPHLRTLVLESIAGSSVVEELAHDLRGIALNEGTRGYVYRERSDAASALAELEPNHIDWPAVVVELSRRGDEDSTRLAVDIIDEVGYGKFGAALIAEAALAHVGLVEGREANEERSTLGTLFPIARRIPLDRIEEVLDTLAALVTRREIPTDFSARSELADFVARLIVREVENRDPDPIKVLTWLRITPGRHGYSGEERQKLANYFQSNDVIRRSIQHYVMFVERDQERVWSRLWRLSEVHIALNLTVEDVIYFLERLASKNNPTSEDTDIWRELASFVRRTDGRAADILKAARLFVHKRPDLEADLLALAQPVPAPDWAIEQEERRKREARDRAAAWAQHRREFAIDEAALRSGELRCSYPVAQAYLGLFGDIERSLPPHERVGEWLGKELQEAALEGLGRVLDRKDLPSLDQVAQSYSESRRWNFLLPMIASLAERLRLAKPINDLPRDLVITLRIAVEHEALGERIDTDRLVTALETELRADPPAYERYVRMLIEPSIEKRAQHVAGLYSFLHNDRDRALAMALAREWLERFPDLNIGTETELVQVIADAGEFKILRTVAAEKASSGYQDDRHRRNWQAIGLLVDFEAASKAIAVVPQSERALLWHLRDVFGAERHRERPVLTTPAQLGWIIRQFRGLWPNVSWPRGGWSGDENPWDAANFIIVLINRLGADTSPTAAAEMATLVGAPDDSYTAELRLAADLQRRARREMAFPTITLDYLGAVLQQRPPASTSDLMAIIRFALARLQLQIRGNDTDIVGKYYRDDGAPRDEDSCTDRLIEDLERLLPQLGIVRVPQRDMPNAKRADIVYGYSDFALPVECKGQWNSTLWTAASSQLDAFYLRDWQAQNRGIYIVYWFGDAVPAHRKLRSPPLGIARPSTPDSLRDALVACIPAERRGSIAVEVLDLRR